MLGLSLILRAILVGVVLLICGSIVLQCRKPTWWLGRLIARIMNRSHYALTSWALEHLSIGSRFQILDVGCGGGATVARLARLAPEGWVFGVDYSAASVATARKTNAALIRAGRVDIALGSVSALPFDTATFDLVTAFETHYYWPDLPADLREVRRTLRPGGTCMIVGEAYRKGRVDWLFWPVMALIGARYLTADQHRDALVEAGYADVQIFEHPTNGWMCAVGRHADT